MKERGFDSTLYVYPDMGHDITPHYGEIMKITESGSGRDLIPFPGVCAVFHFSGD
jgi:hypothetical protein